MSKKSDFLFNKQSSRFFLPWICALMVFIATLVLAGGIATHNSLNLWQKSVAESLTLQIPTYDNGGNPRGELVYRDIENALMLLRTTPGVLGAIVLNDDQMQELMTPWLGSDAAVSELPLPKLIDVSVDTNHPPLLEQLKADLANSVPDAVLDSHRIWLGDLVRFANALLTLIGLILILLFVTVAITVVYTTNASLSIQEYVLSLVHMLGAQDLYITNRYAWHNFKVALGGSFVGFVLALPVMFGISMFLKSVSGQILQSSLHPIQWTYLLLIPVGVALLAFITTFKTVWKFLRRFL
ncbi:MAG: hypothetical protein II938_00260 [Alphaproteobacteria bacterium]|nr:hypothetical protein [Alphaproteobacteria bacterium]